jgi:hypothetical protein
LFSESRSGLEKARSCLASFGALKRSLEELSKDKAARHAKIVLSNDEQLSSALSLLEHLNWEDRGPSLAGKFEKASVGIGEAVLRISRQYDYMDKSPAAMLIFSQFATWLAGELEQLVAARRKLSVDCGVALESLAHELKQALRQFCDPAELRTAFERIQHISNVLAVESSSDLCDLWDSTWPITAGDVRSLASKRSDFTAKDVAGLKFRT